MRRGISIYPAALLLLTTSLLFIACSGSKNIAASTFSEQEISNAVDSSRWQFVANLVSPQSGRTRQVNGLYSVTRRDNKLVVYLPYFGRATGGADIFNNKSPLDFTSTDFTPIIQKPTAGEWRIEIKPKDYREVQVMNCTFFTNGSASLNVIMTNRSAISFTGRIEPAKQ